MPRGASATREREYNELKREFKKEHRYKGREEEVAARIVNKQRAQFGETKAEKRKDRKGKSPDRGLPISNYQHKTIDEVERAMEKLAKHDLKDIEKYEKKHKNRKTLLAAIREQMKNGGSPKSRTHSRSRSKNHSRSDTGSQSKKSPSSRKIKSHSSDSHNGSDHGGKVTTDHDEIRRWVEERAPSRQQLSGRNMVTIPGLFGLIFPGIRARDRSRKSAGTIGSTSSKKRSWRFYIRTKRPAERRAILTS